MQLYLTLYASLLICISYKILQKRQKKTYSFYYKSTFLYISLHVFSHPLKVRVPNGGGAP